ncbi:hypothetical protein H9M94_02905 [Mycoplasma sp. Pen4]|uniref:hypothetical protein n=1 Tax=Mycoplasma sp. Pen4 TaxID=640330 RepID=UPI00165485F3|nr:hypothetical protein [Mycoplasma sp. Pen4]QNM93536.1 hypothetical protein H9M94_02905 [Mycoplasma sp. Pen4]
MKKIAKKFQIKMLILFVISILTFLIAAFSPLIKFAQNENNNIWIVIFAISLILFAITLFIYNNIMLTNLLFSKNEKYIQLRDYFLSKDKSFLKKKILKHNLN